MGFTIIVYIAKKIKNSNRTESIRICLKMIGTIQLPQRIVSCGEEGKAEYKLYSE